MHFTYMQPPTREEIERRAYQIYLEQGLRSGNDVGDWLAAEKELTELWERGEAYRYSANGVAILRKHAVA